MAKLIAEGHSSGGIAGLFAISPKTVERHRANILDKLELRDRVEVTRYTIRNGLVSPDPAEVAARLRRADRAEMGVSTDGRRPVRREG